MRLLLRERIVLGELRNHGGRICGVNALLTL